MGSGNENGSTLAFALATAAAAAVLFLAIAQSQRSRSKEKVYLTAMNRSYRLAETGLQQSLGRIAAASDAYLQPAFKNEFCLDDEGGCYRVDHVERIEDPVPAGFYIVTSATVTQSGRRYPTRLHTYARVSNASEYFAAVSDELVVSAGVDASQGRLYAPNLRFLQDPPKETLVERADYLNSLNPPQGWSGTTKDNIEIAQPTTGDYPNEPQQLSAAVVFPQLLDQDMDRFKDLAGLHKKCDFRDDEDIFPPCYVGGGVTGDSDYSVRVATHGGTGVNAHHVYYCEDDPNTVDKEALYIGGDNTEIHGQIYFVSEGDIVVTGRVKSAPDAAELPGAGTTVLHRSSSTAHQAIFITRSRVLISNTSYARMTGADPKTQNLEAFILAPNGTLEAQSYADPTTHTKLALDFKGAMTLSTLNTAPPNNLPTVFAAGRTYRYNPTLKTNPPPYLPAISEIYYSLEESGASDGIY